MHVALPQLCSRWFMTVWIVRDEPDSWRAQWCVIVDGKRFVAKLKIIEQKSKPNCLPGGICVTGDRWQVV